MSQLTTQVFLPTSICSRSFSQLVYAAESKTELLATSCANQFTNSDEAPEEIDNEATYLLNAIVVQPVPCQTWDIFHLPSLCDSPPPKPQKQSRHRQDFK